MSFHLLFEAILFSFVLSIDSFSAALAMGFRGFTRGQALNFGLMSGLSEGLVALAGFFSGKYLLDQIRDYDHWVAFGLLLAVGLRMIYTAFRSMRAPHGAETPTGFHAPMKVVFVSIVTSLDALGVGVSLGISGKPVLLYAPLISCGAFAATLAGLYLARGLSKRFGPRCEIFGGCVLILLAFQLLKI